MAWKFFLLMTPRSRQPAPARPRPGSAARRRCGPSVRLWLSGKRWNRCACSSLTVQVVFPPWAHPTLRPFLRLSSLAMSDERWAMSDERWGSAAFGAEFRAGPWPHTRVDVMGWCTWESLSAGQRQAEALKGAWSHVSRFFAWFAFGCGSFCCLTGARWLSRKGAAAI